MLQRGMLKYSNFQLMKTNEMIWAFIKIFS